MRHVYLAATGQNRGKTTISLGVLDGFQKRGLAVGFIKPVGQRTVIEDGVPADEDAILMRSVFGLTEPLDRMTRSTSHVASRATTSRAASSRTCRPASGPRTPASLVTATSCSSRAPDTPVSER